MAIGAMILAAGRGLRMRPLTDTVPKPLLPAGGRPLIEWQIEALARAGLRTIVVNASHLASRLTEALGDGARFGVTLRWSIETEPLETAGGIVNALPLLPPGPALVVSGDICTDFDYRSLVAQAQSMARDAAMPRVHLVMVDNPPYHPGGDFVLARERDAGSGRRKLLMPPPAAGERTLTYANIGVLDTGLLRGEPAGKRALLPYFRRWIGAGIATGESFAGRWANVGTPQDLARLDDALREHPMQERTR